MAALLAVYLLSGFRCGGGGGSGVQLEPLAGPRLVMASRGPGDNLTIRMSIDGLVWTEPLVVNIGGTRARIIESPGLFHDGTLYHLYWLDPNGDLRYATSRNAISWLGQTDPITRLGTAVSPAFARGANITLAVFSTSGGDVVALDTGSSTQRRSVVTRGGVVPPSIAYGNGKFVIVAAANRNVGFFESADGTSWASAASLARDLYVTQLSFADGQFLLAAKERLTNATTCRLFTSTDARTWTESPAPGCSSSSTGLLATRLNGQTLYFENWDNRFLRTSRAPALLQDTHAIGLLNQPSIIVGPGPQLAALRLDQATVRLGTGQDLTIVGVGFRARVGVPNSAHATFASGLREFATDVDAVRAVPIPPQISPFAWVVQPAQRPAEANGQVDIMGAILVGIERGSCPEGPIRSRIEEVRRAFETQLEAKIARGQLSQLTDAATRQRVLQEIQDEVKKSLAGEPATWFEEVGTDLACGFNREDQFKEAAIVLLGTALVASEPRSNIFNLSNTEPDLPFSTVVLASTDGDQEWRIEGRRIFLGNP